MAYRDESLFTHQALASVNAERTRTQSKWCPRHRTKRTMYRDISRLSRDAHYAIRGKATTEIKAGKHKKLHGLFVDQWQPLWCLYCWSVVDVVPRERPPVLGAYVKSLGHRRSFQYTRMGAVGV